MAAPAEVPPGAKRALSHTAAPLHISYHFVFGRVWFVFLCYPFPAVAYIYDEYCHVVEWTGESVSDQDISSDDGHILTTVLHDTYLLYRARCRRRLEDGEARLGADHPAHRHEAREVVSE